MHTFFATTSAGLETVLATELQALGLEHIRAGRGGVRFAGRFDGALRACLWSRTAMRVLWPIAQFDAADADSLYDGIYRIDWRDVLSLRHTFAVEAVGTTEGLVHTHYTALRVKDAICDQFRETSGARPTVDPHTPDVRVLVHLSKGHVDVSLDVSGDPLFRRGYRSTPVRASMKETLAAAMLLAAGYDGKETLLDPMCGAGTLALEAAQIAHNRAPGLNRSFGVERWPMFDDGQRRRLDDLRSEARAAIRQTAPLIAASDRDPEAVEATQRNALSLGLPVKVSEGDAREIAPLDPAGWIVANPPYGDRLDGGGKKALKTFFWQLGQSWRKLDGHRALVLAGAEDFESAFGIRPTRKWQLWNGPIACTLLSYRLGYVAPAERAPRR